MGQDCRGVLCFLFSLDLCPSMGFLGPKVLLCYFSNDPPYCSLLDEPMYIVINSSGGLPCLYTLSSICSCLNSFIWSSVFGRPGPWLQESSSLCSERGLFSGLSVTMRLLTVVASGCSAGPRAPGCRGRGGRPQGSFRGSRAQARQPWTYGPSGPTDAESPETMAPIRVSCIGRRILNTAPPGTS